MFTLGFRESTFCTITTKDGTVTKDRSLDVLVEGAEDVPPLVPNQETHRVELSPGQWFCWEEYWLLLPIGTIYQFGIWYDEPGRRGGLNGYWSSRPSVMAAFVQKRMVGIGNSSMCVELKQCDLRGLPESHDMYFHKKEGSVAFYAKGWEDERFVPVPRTPKYPPFTMGAVLVSKGRQWHGY